MTVKHHDNGQLQLAQPVTQLDEGRGTDFLSRAVDLNRDVEAVIQMPVIYRRRIRRAWERNEYRKPACGAITQPLAQRPGLRGSVYSRRRRATVTGTRRVLSAESSAVSIRIAKATTAAVAAAIYKALEKPVAKLVRAAAITIALRASGR